MFEVFSGLNVHHVVTAGGAGRPGQEVAGHGSVGGPDV